MVAKVGDATNFDTNTYNQLSFYTPDDFFFKLNPLSPKYLFSNYNSYYNNLYNGAERVKAIKSLIFSPMWILRFRQLTVGIMIGISSQVDFKIKLYENT